MTLKNCKQIAALIIKHRNKTITVEENEQLIQWCRLDSSNQKLLDDLNNREYVEERLSERESVNLLVEWNKLKQNLSGGKKEKSLKLFLAFFGVVVALTLLYLLFIVALSKVNFNSHQKDFYITHNNLQTK